MPAPAATHCSLNVADLDASVAFYRALTGEEPRRREHDYAKFELADPPLVLALVATPRSGQNPINHVGLRVPDLEALERVRARLQRVGLAGDLEQEVECCYSMQTKFWTADPDGTWWEIYIAHGDAAGLGRTEPAAAPPAAASVARTWTHRLADGWPEAIPHEDAALDEVLLEGSITWRDLTALPCSHPHCCSVGYFLKDDSGAWKSLVGLIGHERLKEFLDLNPDLLANRIADSNVNKAIRDVVKNSLLDLLSEQSSLSHPSMSDIWRDICVNCDLGIGTLATLAASRLPGQQQRLRSMLADRVLRVTIKPFMDIHTMIEERLTQCCVHVATVNESTEAHQCAPFCAVQAWAPLSRTRISTATGGRELIPVTASGR